MAYRRKRRTGSKRRFKKRLSARRTNQRSYGKTKSKTVRVRYGYRKNVSDIFYLPRIGENPRSVVMQYRTQAPVDLVIPSVSGAPDAGQCRVAVLTGSNGNFEIFNRSGRSPTLLSLGATFDMKRIDTGVPDLTNRKNRTIVNDVFQREIVKKCMTSILVRNEETFSVMVFILPLNRTREDAGAGERRTLTQQAGLVEFTNTMTRQELARNPYARGYVIPARPGLGTAQFGRNKRLIDIVQYPASAARKIDRFQDNLQQDGNSCLVGAGTDDSPANYCGFMMAVVPYETSESLTTATIGPSLVCNQVSFKFNIYQDVKHYAPVATLS